MKQTPNNNFMTSEMLEFEDIYNKTNNAIFFLANLICPNSELANKLYFSIYNKIYMSIPLPKDDEQTNELLDRIIIKQSVIILTSYSDAPIFDNKEEMYKIYNKFLKRQWMVLNENNYNDFLDFFKQNKVIIVKPIDGEGGKGIEKYEYINDEESKIVYSSLLFKKQLLVEQCIKQHPDMNKLYNKSVNTLRMFTFYKDGQAYFLQAILKVGNGGVVDNFSSGGMYTYVDDEGTVYAEAIDQMDNKYYKHPISNETIVGFKVPMFKEAVSMVKEAAKVVPEMGYIGWDVAISEDGPVLVEGNCYPGVFQVKPSLVEKKEGIIPKYNKVMRIFGNCYNANN